MNKKEIATLIKTNVKKYVERYGLDGWERLTFPEIVATEGIPSDLIETEFSGSYMAWESFLHDKIGETLVKWLQVGFDSPPTLNGNDAVIKKKENKIKETHTSRDSHADMTEVKRVLEQAFHIANGLIQRRSPDWESWMSIMQVRVDILRAMDELFPGTHEGRK